MNTCDDCAWRKVLEEEIENLKEHLERWREIALDKQRELTAAKAELLTLNSAAERIKRIQYALDALRETNAQLRKQLAQSERALFIGVHTTENHAFVPQVQGRKITIDEQSTGKQPGS